MFKIEITTDNAAFEGDDLGAEVAKHLIDLARRIGDMSRERIAVMCNRTEVFTIRDSNGNRCGSARFENIAED